MAELNTHQPAAPESQAHIEAMIAKADGLTPPASQADPNRPAWLPEKFSSAEDMAKAYAELEKQFSARAPQQPATPPATEPAPTTDPAPAAEAAQAAEKAGLDLAAVEAEFQKDGKLSDATYEALAKAGFDKARVDTYIAGQQAIAAQLQSSIENHVGGADKLNSMLEWAGKGGLTQAEIDAFNTQVDKADEAGIKLAMDGLRAKYEAANGREPALLNGSVNAASGDVFRSTAEVTAAMKDARYAKDPAYRAEVEAKLARSSIF